MTAAIAAAELHASVKRLGNAVLTRRGFCSRRRGRGAKSRDELRATYETKSDNTIESGHADKGSVYWETFRKC